MNKIIKNTLIFSILTLINFSSIASNANLKEVEKFVNSISNKSIAIINNKELSDQKKQDLLSDLFTQFIDIDWIGRFSLSRYWGKITQEQKEEYKKLYQLYLVNRYVPNFKKCISNSLKITSINEIAKNEYMVNTEINIEGQSKPVKISYKIAKKGRNEFIIFDIITEGISLVLTHRSEFSSIVASSGIESLLGKLRVLANTKNY